MIDLYEDRIAIGRIAIGVWLLVFCILIMREGISAERNPVMSDNNTMMSVLLEIKIPETVNAEQAMQAVRNFHIPGFIPDDEYTPVPMQPGDSTRGLATVIVHGWVDSEQAIKALQSRDEVVNIWSDTVVAPMEAPN